MDRFIRAGVALLGMLLTGCLGVIGDSGAGIRSGDPDAADGSSDTRSSPLRESQERVATTTQREALFARGARCDASIVLEPGVLYRGETPDTGLSSTQCEPSNAPQRFYSFVLPPHRRAIVSATSRTRGVRVVLRAMSRCDSTSCLGNDTTRVNGQTATLSIDGSTDEAVTNIVTVSSTSASSRAEFDIGVLIVPIDRCTGDAVAPAHYAVREIAPLHGDVQSAAADLDDLGNVLANSTSSFGRMSAYVWHDGTVRALPTLGNSTHAFAIDNRGDIAGVAADTTGNLHPVVWRDGRLVDLAPPGSFGEAYDVNEAGTVVGYITRNGHRVAATWDRDNVLSAISVAGAASSVATAINDFGQIVGRFELPTGEQRAFLYDRDVFTDLGTPFDVRAIANDASTVTNALDYRMQPSGFLFEHNGWANSSTLPAVATGIADSHSIVGWLPAPPGAAVSDHHAFVAYASFDSDSLTPRDLNGAIDAASGWVLVEARRVDSCGRIAGSGVLHGREAFLLTPACSDGLTDCRGHCVDLASDAANCGACGRACPSGIACHASSCECAVETCNGLDDDCDGVVDNVATPMIRCGVGSCFRTVAACDSGTPGTCVPGSPSAETCNGLDDDCDGAIDNVAVPTLQCGVGSCLRVVPACVAGTPTTCAPGAPAPEVCNGLDDDCDGAIDNVAVATVHCGVGSCLRAVPACVSGTPAVCVPGTPVPDECNGADDDCDGVIDNGCSPCSSGRGRCGTATCTDFSNDDENCGGCGIVCAPPLSCHASRCG